MPFEVPSNWVWVTLEEITSTIGDGLHGTPQYNSEGDYFFINGNNLSNRKIVIKNETKRVSVSEYEKYKKPLNRSSILVSINGTIGNIGIYDGEKIMLGKSACYMNMVSPINIQYICIILESQYFLKYAIDSATGSTIKNVPLKAINNFKLPFPPVSEQQRIVAEIEQWFALIDQIEQDKVDLRTIIKQTKKKILDLAIHGKLVPQDPNDEPAIELLKRINPDFTPCDNGHYTQLPKGWTTIKVGDVAIYTNGRAFKPEDWMREGLPIIRIQNLNDNSASYNRTPKTYESKYLIHNGDLLFAWAASLGTYIWNGGKAWLNQHIFKVEPYPFIEKQYLYHVFKAMITEFYTQSHGSGMVHITKKQFENIKLLLPPLEEQKRIVQTLEQISTKLDVIMGSL